ncbi:hypothetical protein GJV82_15625 [Cellulosimicrobium sp. BIT-GX5]|uniref:Glycosyltransferase family 2 protein n=1 Tax=Cellulosimicrobium composti TaxID=2672572 RepID=A0A6N7ZLG6_9MICO|nr:hypothetical protein [Cellulosimicrobium composti]MTG90355.1 hypothetical protein [Cellulosimicrobium composti]NDO90616.1 hypothetical protein [Cellulosimicrobium composti]HEV6954734.1 hypothetical protein [Promicromonospora sp.]
MRLAAYVLLADPSFLAASLRAYYDRVDRIVLSYDETSTSWTGTPLPVDECLAIVKELDTDDKCVHAPGRFARLDEHPLDNDTFQRQTALDEASRDADWVLQLDTDEVMLSPDAFVGSLGRAEAAGASGLDFPSRWLYSRVAPGRYLEASSRLGRPAASYPGPLAVRAGTRLVHARQADVPLYRVDLGPWNTDPARPRDAIVHEVVDPGAAVLHFSWVRRPEAMRQKFGWSGHTAHYSRPGVYESWVERTRHPRRTALTSPFRRRDWFRLVTVPEPPGGEP